MDKIRAVAASVGRSRLWRSTRARLWDADEERGQGLAEYSLILAGIAVVSIVSLVFLGGTITELFWDPISEDFGKVLCDIIGICPT